MNYKQVRDSNLWSLYTKVDLDILERIQSVFVLGMESQIAIENYVTAKDYRFCACELLDKLESYIEESPQEIAFKYPKLRIELLQKRLSYCERAIELKLDAKKATSLKE